MHLSESSSKFNTWNSLFHPFIHFPMIIFCWAEAETVLGGKVLLPSITFQLFLGNEGQCFPGPDRRQNPSSKFWSCRWQSRWLNHRSSLFSIQRSSGCTLNNPTKEVVTHVYPGPHSSGHSPHLMAMDKTRKVNRHSMESFVFWLNSFVSMTWLTPHPTGPAVEGLKLYHILSQCG